MSAMAGAIEKAVVDSENVMREWISDKHMSEEEKRQREARISTKGGGRRGFAHTVGRQNKRFQPVGNRLKKSQK